MGLTLKIFEKNFSKVFLDKIQRQRFDRSSKLSTYGKFREKYQIHCQSETFKLFIKTLSFPPPWSKGQTRNKNFHVDR